MRLSEEKPAGREVLWFLPCLFSVLCFPAASLFSSLLAECWIDGEISALPPPPAGLQIAPARESVAPAEASVKGDNKRLTSPGSSTSTTEEEEELFREEESSSVFFSIMDRVWKERDYLWSNLGGILRAHLTNGILSMFLLLLFLPIRGWSLHGGMLMLPQLVRVCLWLLGVWLY